ncbi:MAG: dipeptidase [Pseudomonadota bacterium]
MTKVAIFDGHNDLLARLYFDGPGAADSFHMGRPRGHLDATKAKTGGFLGGLFALWVPSAGRGQDPASTQSMQRQKYDLPLPQTLDREHAKQVVWKQISLLRDLEANNAVSMCTTADAVETTMNAGQIAAVLHLEGAECIDPDLEELDALYDAGLRSLGPVWSRPTIFGDGVPFRFPSSPDTGNGLTALGKKLIKRCGELSIMVDVSHLTERGFWDVAEHSSQPLVATHSNAHALSPHSRNLTDAQLYAISGSKGLVGVNFATSFLRDDGRMVSDTPRDLILRHIDYLIERMGEDCVALGSDFDGAIIPRTVGSVAGLQEIVADMRERGYSSDLIKKICHGNWMRTLRLAWGQKERQPELVTT